MEIPEADRAHLLLLRRRAEEALQGKLVELSDLTNKDFQYLLHELQVHQTELVMQNAELRRVQLELETSLDRYSDLYNFAPAGYCTISRKDRILEANKTLAVLLGVEKKNLIHNTLSHFVAREYQDKYYLHRQRAFKNRLPQASEIRLVKPDGEGIFVRLESQISQNAENQLMVMLIDITRQRELQQHLVEQREQERKKLAQDLHDGPVQALAAINFALRGILMDHPGSSLAPSLEEIQASVREQLQVLRDYSIDLRPALLAHLGLELAIRAHVESFQVKFPRIFLRMDLQPTGTLLPETTSVALYRICQEAFLNISKHASTTATEVSVRLLQEDHQVHLEICDNGEGFDLPEDWLDFINDGRLGLLGMRERAEAVGGQLEILSSRGNGTCVKAAVPH